MIRLGRISDVGKRAGEECLLIVRSLKQCPHGAVHVPQLSPSPALFHRYLIARDVGKYDAEWFQRHYVPRFLREMLDMENRELLDRLYRESKEKDILLACFCGDEATCHRSIVGGLLLSAGADIECRQEYARYWEMFKELMEAA